MRYLLLIVALANFSCAMHTAPLTPIPLEESDIIAAAIQHEVSGDGELMTRRPIVFLDSTDNWVPQDPPESLPVGFAKANKAKYGLQAVNLPQNVSMYSARLFDKTYQYAKPSKEMVKQFGKEPFVVSVSRPIITADGKAHLLLHRLSTWSGCGGVNVIHLAKNGDKWGVEDWDLYMFW